MAMCPQAESAGMIASALAMVDCHIGIIVHDTSRALVASNAWFVIALPTALVIHVAVVGYQLATGRDGARLLDVPVGACKIGLIFAFLSLWAAYQAPVFRFLFDGPSEIVATLAAPLASLSADGTVLSGVQTAFADMMAASGVYGDMTSPAENVLQGGPMLASGALWLAAMLMLLITLGLLSVAKIVLALLLVFGPIFFGLFLFVGTRDLSLRWLRATITFAVAPLAANVMGAAMLLMLAPFLGMLVKNVGQQAVDIGPVMTISLIVVVFAVAMILGLRALALIGHDPERGARRWQDLVPEHPVTADKTGSAQGNSRYCAPPQAAERCLP